MLEGVAALITALTGLLSTLGAKHAWEYFQARQEVKRSAGTKRAFKIGCELIGELHTFRMAVGAHRAMVIAAHNCNGPITVTKPTFTSVLHQVHDEHLPQEDWKEVPVDEGYWDVLRQVSEAGQHGHVELRRDGLLPGSDLRNLYESHGIAGSVVFELYATESRYFYVSANRKDDDGDAGDPFGRLSDAALADNVRRARVRLTDLLKAT